MKRELALLAVVYIACVALAALLWRRPMVLTACYAVLSILVLHRWHTRGDVVFYAMAFVLGPLGEFVGVSAGAWKYFGTGWVVPAWLPFLWGVVAVFLKRTCENVTQTFTAREH